MVIDIKNPSVDPSYLFSDFILWLKNNEGHYTYTSFSILRVNSQIYSWDLKTRIGLWADLSWEDKEIDVLLYCWVRLGFLKAFGFEGAHVPYVYVFKKGLAKESVVEEGFFQGRTLDNQPH